MPKKAEFSNAFLHELTRRASGALSVVALAVGLASAAHAAPVSGLGTWETTLQGRDLDGNTATFEAYYDDVLNITWLADANYAKTRGYFAANLTQTPNYGAPRSYGGMTWNEAQTWADNLVVGAYSDWRLPTVVDTGTSGCNFSLVGGTECGYNAQTVDAATGTVYSEIAHLYHVTLGNKAYITPGTEFGPQPGWGLQNTGPFSNVWPTNYWYGVEYALDSDDAWYFDAYVGYQSGRGEKYYEFLAWAVRPGDVSALAVPEPSTYVLMGLGLAALAVARGRRRH